MTITTLSLRYVKKNVGTIYELNFCLCPGHLISFKSSTNPCEHEQVHGMIISVMSDTNEIKILWSL